MYDVKSLFAVGYGAADIFGKKSAIPHKVLYKECFMGVQWELEMS